MKTSYADNETIARMRAVNPAAAEDLRAELDAEALAAAMNAAIARGETPREPVPAGDSVARSAADGRFGRLAARPATLVGGLACAALVALLVLLAGTPGGGGRPEFAAAAVEVAEANPRLLVTAPGWSVVDAGEFEAGEGEVRFGEGSHELSINWYPAGMYRSYLRDRSFVSAPETSSLLGLTATTVEYTAGEYATMLAPDGPVFVEIRGQAGDRADYDAVLGSLRAVDVDTWLAAMPASVVKPEDRSQMVERMLTGVPVPPDFDLAALQNQSEVLNHYQLATEVSGTVACGWVESWLTATAAGDAAGARKAVAAMASSRSWPLLIGIGGEGSWASNVWHVAAELERGHLNRGAAGSLVHPDGSGYEMGPAWALALNCESAFWRRPLSD
jgi:hypothetical protein